MLRIIAIIFKAHLRRAVLANRNSGVGTDNLTPNPQTFAEQEKLGIDALALTDEPDRFAEMLRNRKVGIKAALVDQQFIAGLGNIYVDEILFRARISPRAKASELSDQGVRRLLSAMRQVLDLAIRHQAAPVRLPRSWLLRHRHRGDKCPRCGGAINSASISGRTAYFCPGCQAAK